MPYWNFNSWDLNDSFVFRVSKKLRNIVKNSVNSPKIKNNFNAKIHVDTPPPRRTRESTGYKYNFNTDDTVVTPPPTYYEEKPKVKEKKASTVSKHEGQVLITEKSIVPIYAVAIPWIIGAFLLPMYRWYDFLILTFASLIVFFISKSIFKGKKVYVEKKEVDKKVKTGNAIVDKVIEEGLGFLKQMEKADEDILNEILSDQIKKIEKLFKQMIEIVRDDPSKAHKIKSFMNYYVPATIKLLNYYDKLEEQKVEGENITYAMKSIEKAMQTITKAFEKQLDSLFEEDVLDISTDIEVLENMFTQEGLLDSDFKNVK